MLRVVAAGQVPLDKPPQRQGLAVRVVRGRRRQSLVRLSLTRVAAVAASTQVELRALAGLAVAARVLRPPAVAPSQRRLREQQIQAAAVVEVAAQVVAPARVALAALA